MSEGRRRRRTWRAIAILVVVAGAFLAGSGTASGHAQLVGTDPVGGRTVSVAPARVTMTFSESVEVSPDSVRLFDAAGERVEVGRTGHPTGEGAVVGADLPALADGTYVVTWRVVSADSHPIHGAFSFHVGASTSGVDERALAARLLNAEGGSVAVGAVYGVLRLVVFASMALLVGGVAFVAGLWPAGRGDGPARRMLWTAWAVLVGTTVLSIGAQGAYGGALGLADVFAPETFGDVLSTRFGTTSLLRLALLAAAAGLLVALLRPGPADRPSMPWLVGAGIVGAGLVATPGLGGHALTGDLVAVALPSDAVHLGAGSVWAGGLALLALRVLPRGEREELTVVVPRFSTVAAASVAAVVASGAFQSWRQVRSVDALTSTTYGRLLIVKALAVGAMIALGALGRQEVRRRWPSPVAAATIPRTVSAAEAARQDVGALRRSVGAEVVMAVVVLVVTSLLVASPPARTALAQPFSATLPAGAISLDVSVDPARTGGSTIHFYALSQAGTIAEVDEMTAELSLPSKELGPLELPLYRGGPGHFLVDDYPIPLPGDWELTVAARIGTFDQFTARATFTVR